jgi:hypothetical protein
MSIKIPYIRKEKSTLFSSSAIAMLLLAGPLVISNFLFQPVQAQTAMTFKTLKPAISSDGNLLLTFDAQGTTSSSTPSQVDITNGTIQWQENPNGPTATGEIKSGEFSNNTRGGKITFTTSIENFTYNVYSDCRTSENSIIDVTKETFSGGDVQYFMGPVECTSSQGDTKSSSMSGTTTTTHDSDGDGIPDSSDRCTHNSNQRCYKEDTTTQQEQQPSSSSSGTGNQTKG